MAYLDHDTMFAAPVISRCQASLQRTTQRIGQNSAAPKPAGFSALEWSVIAIAQRDTLASLKTPGRMARALGGVFGRGPSSRLADPKLEALRRLAVHARHRGFAVPVEEIAQFHAVGFSKEQMETLITSVTGIRVGQDERRPAA